jgi:protein Xni
MVTDEHTMQVLLVDGFNLIRRIYEARPHDDGEIQQDVIDSVTSSLARAIRRFRPSHGCCVFDSQDKTWRHLLYSDYKQNRQPTPAPLLNALTLFEQSFNEIGIRCLNIPGYEADDVIATLASKISQAQGQVTILSTDKGFLQLLSEKVTIYDHFKDRAISEQDAFRKFGVHSYQLLDFWALTGDLTNNIKGVPGIGPKTAQQLLQEYDTLDNLLATESTGKAAERVYAHTREAIISRQLVGLKVDVEVGTNLKDLRVVPVTRKTNTSHPEK